MKIKNFKRIIPDVIWRELRLTKILRTHLQVSEFCKQLVENHNKVGVKFRITPMKPELVGKKIIWQYWAQGYEKIPDIVRECLKSVKKNRGDYTLIRLTDENVSEYIDLPCESSSNSRGAGLAFYSDLLRVAILSVYGGVWLDATVFLSAPLKNRLGDNDFFMFQRDPKELNQHYWEGTYAYYFGWRKGFKVNVLNSVIYAKPGSKVITDLFGVLLKFWSENRDAPDYFFFQILFDVLINGPLKGMNCPIQSDCIPHYLQQFRNDPEFLLFSEPEILGLTEIHKLTYKYE